LPQTVTPQKLVILRESGGSSTPRLLDSITGASGYWVAPVKPGDDTGGVGIRSRRIVTDPIFKQPNSRHSGMVR
jgi:hypothetical protein